MVNKTVLWFAKHLCTAFSCYNIASTLADTTKTISLCALNLTRGTITALILIWHEDLALPHPESSVVMHNLGRDPLPPRSTTRPEGLPCLLRLVVFAVAPHVERFLHPHHAP